MVVIKYSSDKIGKTKRNGGKKQGKKSKQKRLKRGSALKSISLH